MLVLDSLITIAASFVKFYYGICIRNIDFSPRVRYKRLSFQAVSPITTHECLWNKADNDKPL